MIIKPLRLVFPKHPFDYLFLLLLALVPFWKIGFDGIFNKLDNVFPLYVNESFQSSLFLWNDKLFAGYFNGAASDMPRLAIFALLDLVGFEIGIIERLYFIGMFATLGIGMYYLILTIEGNSRLSTRIGAIFAGSFYMINPYTFFRLQGTHPTYILASALIPPIFVFIVKGLNRSEECKPVNLLEVLAIGLLSILLFTTGEPLILLAMLIFSSFVVYRFFSLVKKGTPELFAGIKFVSITVLTTLLFISSQIITILTLYSTGIYNQAANMGANEGIMKYESHITYLDMFRLWPSWLGTLRFPFTFYWNQIFTSPQNILFGVSFFLLGLLAFILRPRNRYVLFMGLILVIIIPFRMGANPPFDKSFMFIWDNIPLFHGFRDLYRFTMVLVFVFSVLLGLSINGIVTNISKKVTVTNAHYLTELRKKMVVGAILILLMATLFANVPPILSGDVDGMIAPMQIPNYYGSAKAWFDSKGGDYRILLIPFGTIDEYYKWAPKYDIISYADRMFTQPVWPINPIAYGEEGISGVLSPGEKQMARLINQTVTDGDNSALELMKLANIRYVTIREDTMISLPREKFSDPIKIIPLEANKAEATIKHKLKKVASFGDFGIYENPGFNPIVHAPKTMYLLDGWSSLQNTLNNEDKNGSKAFILQDDLPQEELHILRQTGKLSFIRFRTEPNMGTLKYTVYNDTSSLHLDFQKLSPTKYLVKVNTNHPFVLILGEKYDVGWRVKLDGPSSVEPYHFVANGYANGWFIETLGEQNIILEFGYQNIQDIGKIVSLVSVVLFISYVSLNYLKRGYRS